MTNFERQILLLFCIYAYIILDNHNKRLKSAMLRLIQVYVFRENIRFIHNGENNKL